MKSSAALLISSSLAVCKTDPAGSLPISVPVIAVPSISSKQLGNSVHTYESDSEMWLKLSLGLYTNKR